MKAPTTRTLKMLMLLLGVLRGAQSGLSLTKVSLDLRNTGFISPNFLTSAPTVGKLLKPCTKIISNCPVYEFLIFFIHLQH